MLSTFSQPTLQNTGLRMHLLSNNISKGKLSKLSEFLVNTTPSHQARNFFTKQNYAGISREKVSVILGTNAISLMELKSSEATLVRFQTTHKRTMEDSLTKVLFFYLINR
jgi:hypothetical protein